jgi:hypothetical protein
MVGRLWVKASLNLENVILYYMEKKGVRIFLAPKDL